MTTRIPVATTGSSADIAPAPAGAQAKALAVLRIATGLIFLWAFLDKLFGLGYATPGAKAWIAGGSPTKGFLSSVDVGPFTTAFHAIAGTWWADWLFMLGLLGVGARGDPRRRAADQRRSGLADAAAHVAGRVPARPLRH